MEEEQTTYYVVGYDMITGRRKVYAETTDPADAFQTATELDAVSKVGDEEDLVKYGHPQDITIEDQNGNDVWQECSRARCPSAGLLQ